MPITLRQTFNPDKIKGYHAHVYYADPVERELAAAIRVAAIASYEVVMGRWRGEPVGPHPLPMYQIAFEAALFPSFVPWLQSVHGPLSILIHPRTGTSDLIDHSAGAMWIGRSVPLKLEFFDREGKSA
ncbi:MAG TPA: 4,5-dioxygenase [Gammaproteobacteria bacterium]|nr:4,5-dioxygenase [Gammaproteobacteria bacterium]|tara:strand:+ start:1509 stop:1892 length:384 start_codon:yes stop_codon:yes gene_type:complete